MQPKGCYDVITKRTEEALGYPVNPHQFRHCAATTIAERTPEAVLSATRILGHSDPKMTQRYSHLSSSVLQDAANGVSKYLDLQELIYLIMISYFIMVVMVVG